MAEKKNRSKVKRVKTGALERRFSMARAGVLASTRFAAQSAGSLLVSKDKREERQKKILSNQAQWLVDELGKLKGSVVKIGQMMALLGEHFLPEEVTEALHTLEDDTTALEWSAIEKELIKQLGNKKYAELDVDPEPIAAASLGQVHKAVRKSDGEVICLKIQYPGVADAIDSDMNALVQVLILTRIVPRTEMFEEWVEEVQSMMKREVDYVLEAKTTEFFRDALKDDDRYIVPRVFHEYSSKTILATSFEEGVGVSDESILGLSQEKRNHIGKSIMELFCREVFDWKKMQTDPNFGNYLLRISEEDNQDKIILLDFGAYREFEDEIILPARKMIYYSYQHDAKNLIRAFHELDFLTDGLVPESLLQDFSELCFTGVEVLQDPDKYPAPDHVLNENGEYLWGESDLPTRILAQAGQSAFSVHFDVPPKEFIFLSRKLLGAYTFLHVIKAEVRGNYILDPFLKKMEENSETYA